MEKEKLNKTGIFVVTAPFRWLIITALFFFIALGRIDIIRAWIYIGCYFIGSLFSCYIFIKKVPGLANERGKIKQGTKNWDIPIVLLYFLLAIVITPVVAGLDVRFNISVLPFSFLYLGIGLYIFSLVLSIWPMLHNPFFEGTVRIQTDRNQAVINTGPYKVVRHPGYIGMIIGSLPLPFAFGSLFSIIPAIIMIILVIIRTYLEDKTLINELDGYDEYCTKVKYRLIPYIW
jgi:protein-S-isoprenylcysteine O-methyltransferase Ste14